MLNHISYVYHYVKRIVTRRGVNITIYFFMFLISLIVLIKWNTIRNINDSITFETVKQGDIKNDSLSKCSELSISIGNPYIAFSTKGLKTFCKISYLQNENRSKVSQDNNLSRYLNLGDDKSGEKLDFVKNYMEDDVSTLYVIKAKKDVNAVFSNVKNPIVEKLHCDSFDNKPRELIYVRGDLKMNDDVMTQDIVFILANKHYNKYCFYTPNISSSIINSSVVAWSAMYDISQSYYTLNIDGISRYDALKTDSVTLEIDFGGATAFSGIKPAPDEVAYSSIKFTDPKKIEEIFRGGELRFYCQFLETCGVQSTRVYILSTVASFFFGLFAKGVLETRFNFRNLVDMLKGVIKKFFKNICYCWQILVQKIKRILM